MKKLMAKSGPALSDKITRWTAMSFFCVTRDPTFAFALWLTQVEHKVLLGI